MKTIRYAALLATAGLVLTACGDESPSGAGSTPAGSTTTASATSPATGSPTSPPGDGTWVTVTRSGGVAGFSDRVTVKADGVAQASKRGRAARSCRLDPGLLSSVTTAVDAVDWAAVEDKRPTVRHPDDLVIAVATGSGTGRLEDPALKPLVDPVSKLLTATTGSSSDLCRPI